MSTRVVLSVLCLDCGNLVRLRDWRYVEDGESQPCHNHACRSNAPPPKLRGRRGLRGTEAREYPKTCSVCRADFLGAKPAREGHPSFCSRKCKNACNVTTYVPPVAAGGAP